MKSDSEKTKKSKKSAETTKKSYYDWLSSTEKKTFKAWLKLN